MTSSFRSIILKDDAKFCSWGDTVHYNDPPLIFTRCHDHYLVDENENTYFDLQMQNSSANFGYSNDKYLNAMRQQCETLPQLASEFLSKEKVELCKKIAMSAQKRWDIAGRVHLNVGGAQAIDDSLKLVAANKGTRRVFAFEGAYHGRSLGASSITSSYRYRAQYGEFGSRAHFVPYPYCFRCPYGKQRDSCQLYCAKQFQRLFESECQGVIDKRDGSSEFAAFYVEPVQGTAGYIVPPSGYFEVIAATLKQYNILLVSDEIQMGFYRTGKLWSIEHFGVTPDIITFGKSLTNGLNPLSGLWAKEALISPERFPPGSTHSTYASNPLGCKLALTTFDSFENFDTEQHVQDIGEYFLEGLKTLEKKYPFIGHVDGLGLALRIEICEDDGKTPNNTMAKTLRYRAANTDFLTDIGPMRLMLGVGGHYKNVFTLAPALTINRQDVDRAIRLLDMLFEGGC